MLANYRDLATCIICRKSSLVALFYPPKGSCYIRARASNFRLGVGGGGGGGLKANGKPEPTRGDREACSPIPNIFDFNSSKMTGNAFKNNKRNV